MMTHPLGHIAAITLRVLRQLRNDRRLIALSLLFPIIIIYLLNVLIEAFNNPFFNASAYIVPYAGFIVHFITYMLTAIVLVRERTAGTLARMFISGYTQFEIISGYLLAYTALVTVQSLIILAELNWLFELAYTLSLNAAIYLVIWLLAVISMALGILVSNAARNEGQVVVLVPLIVISFILSGVLIPGERLPVWVQWLAYTTPLYYANEILQPLIEGALLRDQLPMLLTLLLYGVGVSGLAILSLRERD